MDHGQVIPVTSLHTNFIMATLVSPAYQLPFVDARHHQYGLSRLPSAHEHFIDVVDLNY
jgi:hypothetical protein